jgi:hypothetical protein
MAVLELLSAAILPSAERRIAAKAMEAATRRGMGATADVGIKIPFLAPEGLLRRVEQDIINTRNMKPGLRKSINEFLMHEGPTSVMYLPSEHGMRIGEALGRITRDLPAQARENLAGLVSLDPAKATAALQRYEGVIGEASKLVNRMPSGSMDAPTLEAVLRRANSALDTAHEVRTMVSDNPIPSGLLAGGTILAGHRLLSKESSAYTTHAAFRAGFEKE